MRRGKWGQPLKYKIRIAVEKADRMNTKDNPNGIAPVVIAIGLFCMGLFSYGLAITELMATGGGWIAGQIGHGLILSGIFLLLLAVYFKKPIR